MNVKQMNVQYTLKEQCKWSLGDPVVFRYVEVTVPDRPSVGMQVLELPEAEACALCIAMGNTDYQLRVLESAAKSSHPSGNPWYKMEAFMAGASLLQKLAQKMTLWLGEEDMKYVHMRIDMRGGDFMITNNSHESIGPRIIELAEAKL